MYNLSYFKEKDKEVLLQFLNDYPFAALTGNKSDGSLVCTQVPILIEEREGEWYLQGHIMKHTDHHKAFVSNPNVLVLFTGPNAYVSASWYANPQIGSTWNYMSVHIKGEVRIMSDDELVAFMKKLTFKFEKNNTESPTIFDNLPEAFISKMMPMIAGFEIKVDQLENVFKLSQNRDEASFKNIIAKLREEGGSANGVADEMEKRIAELFPPGQEWDSSKFMS